MNTQQEEMGQYDLENENSTKELYLKS